MTDESTTITREFRSSFPDWEQDGFRTASWVAGVPSTVQPFHKTILHALAEAARLETTIGFTILAEREGRPSDHSSYREIYHRARSVAAALTDLGVGEGDRVMLVLPTCLDFAAAFFGAQLIRAIPVPAYPPSGLKIEAGLRRLAHIANHSGAKICLTWKKLSPVIGDLATRANKLERIAHVEDLRDHAPLEGKTIRYSSRQIAFLQYTSGSTGNPKGVALTHHALVSNIHAIGQAIKITRNDRYCGWCPLYHDMGLIGQLLFSVYWRIPAVLMSPLAFLSRPVRWLRAISEYGATMSTAPNFGYALAVKRVKPEDREGLDLSTWRVALNGAEPVHLGTVLSFRDTYAPYGFPENALLPVYGLAEASLAVTFATPGAMLHYEQVDRQRLVQGQAVPSTGKGSATLVSVGNAIPGHGAVVVDSDGQPLPEREVGHIIATGPSLMDGYWQDSRATLRVLRDGNLWTGDLGYFADGHLFIAGRAKDIILIRGSNYYAEDLEHSAEAVAGVRPGGTVAFGVYDDRQATDAVVLVCETREMDRDKRRVIAEMVGESVQEECGVAVDQVVLVEPGTIPKTSSGKRQRSLCKRLYLEERLVPERTGKLRLASVFLRSQAGHFLLHARKLMGRSSSAD
jgi:acyl-CoA synthetase (AMP-forming)/AMP-acid ligase II